MAKFEIKHKRSGEESDLKDSHVDQVFTDKPIENVGIEQFRDWVSDLLSIADRVRLEINSDSSLITIFGDVIPGGEIATAVSCPNHTLIGINECHGTCSVTFQLSDQLHKILINHNPNNSIHFFK